MKKTNRTPEEAKMSFWKGFDITKIIIPNKEVTPKSQQNHTPTPIPTPIPTPKNNIKKPDGLPEKDLIQIGSVTKIKEEIEKLSKKLYDEKILLKVHAFVNKMFKENKNERAVLHSLTRCYAKSRYKNDFKKDGGPWAYCTKIIQVENGNYNEAEYFKTKA